MRTGRKVYVVQSRGPGGTKRVTLGRHGEMSADEARKRAAGVIDHIKRGEDPTPKPPEAEPTVSGLAERFMRVHVSVHCKPDTAKVYRSVLDNHILPVLGAMALGEVGRVEVSELRQRLCGTPAVANQAVRSLSLMYRLACDWGMVPEGMNPCRAIDKYPGRRREQFLTEAEFDRLGCALDESETRGGASAPAVAAFRLLMLTGCRKSEILTLRWEDVALDEAELRLADSKTGARLVSLSPPAVKLLAGLPRLPGNPWVIPGKKPGMHL